MEPLKQCFVLPKKAIVSIVGSGGKTSLMWYLAKAFSEENVLVSTTTKIMAPEPSNYDYFSTEVGQELGIKEKGITLAGTYVENTQKLEQPALLSTTFPCFDKVFLEADGSKQLPLKGWESFEPVILPESDWTIGILPLSILGETINETLIHRLPLFLHLTNSEVGEPLTMETLAKVVLQPNGLFQYSTQKKVLFLNQVDEEVDYQLAQQFIEQLPAEFTKKLQYIVAGSVKKEQGRILWSREK